MPAFQYRLSSKSAPITVEDYRRRARRAVPEMVWAYVDSGAEDLTTLDANRSAFDRYRLRSRVLTGNEATDLGVSVLGTDVSLPVLLAPTGVAGLSHWTGEVGVAQAAERAGTVSIVSTAGSYTIEEVAAATETDHVFQLYPWADPDTGRHDLTQSFIDRARNAGYRSLVVTVDVPVHGNREAERTRGMGIPPIVTPRRVLEGALRPRWSAGFLRHRRISARNLVPKGGAKAAVQSLGAQYRMMRPELDWDDLSWVRDHWQGPLYVKGVLDADDAAIAVDRGVDGVIVSNHGGRQLDGAVAALDALPAIVARVGDRVDVLVDGGVRRGSDVVKALCLGATAVCIGRPYLYGLAARGPAGAQDVVEILRQEIRRTMTLMGVATVKELGPSWLLPADTPL
ncbi:alpha-hydroxy acid oxidase [Trujillonella endophytica]|uniref:L-lactate dehydrogenase (Cytochrome) n=1 Tax=Trujillonella endophytica TaxID=673521 RepID=A0A1H8Q655_9ACTN|nr:alpha-hydroxy acid oxidase [Trujillella endophytica]SEO49700.1 L-lactate dehydrogenase (cytochrome) [Trujillella endophytica]